MKYGKMVSLKTVARERKSVQRGCTGFDGLTEDGEFLRGRTPQKSDLNLNAEDNFALVA